MINPRLTTPDVFMILLTGICVGGLGCGLLWAGIWLQIRQPWGNGFMLGAGFGLWLGYYFAVMLIQPRKIPDLNAAEANMVTHITAVVPDYTEGVIGTFPLPPGEFRLLARELLVPGVRFTQGDYKGKYGEKKYKAIRRELFKRGWAVPDYRGTPDLTVAGRHMLRLRAYPPTAPLKNM